ncbi:MAG: cupin domain-containing protein [Gemmatimonadetes bacterium]|uniref:Cupin domain-containing protein n=1 Tax=Candidatus Kutchimonas denitrificans TaxID=3056748 RepID=A0AAE4Z9B4_9BACT|nr:cupin domain-containing protein [Gemmatimonadota bacterium]NIR75418.1 cupin domain-containing protein [Candidatus Kutchimonas denitrificans]NIS01732.1 cupin domain-containing protein [Gemmatimonadota bacterium]NIT67514.1 cupin domain-containing protein [Gemmatimonadota bacterium]NIU53377.1 cupin domain-containing protein [Gemmatimonadota bacterium]
MSGEFFSRVIRFRDYTWKGIRAVSYKPPGESWSGVIRQRLLGPEEALPFHVRYFEIEPGGHTTFEHHDHQHSVIVIRGSGRVRLEDRWEELSFGDVVYVASGAAHQFRAAADEPLGFLCIVDAERDRPVHLEDDSGIAK